MILAWLYRLVCNGRSSLLLQTSDLALEGPRSFGNLQVSLVGSFDTSREARCPPHERVNEALSTLSLRNDVWHVGSWIHACAYWAREPCSPCLRSWVFLLDDCAATEIAFPWCAPRIMVALPQLLFVSQWYGWDSFSLDPHCTTDIVLLGLL